MKAQIDGKSPSTSSKLGSVGQRGYSHGESSKYFQSSYYKAERGALPQHRAYEEMMERQWTFKNRTLDRKRKVPSGTEARVHTEANDQDLYFKTDSKELLTLYQEKKRNLGLGASQKVLPESAGKKLPKTMVRKSGEVPTAGYSYHGQKSRNPENVRGSGSHGPAVGKPSGYYNSAGVAAHQRSSNMKSYATLEQLNYQHSMGLKQGASKGSLQSGPGKKPAGKAYLQSAYNYRGMVGNKGQHFPTSSATQLQSALFQSYMKPVSQGSRIDLKTGQKRKTTSSSGNRTGIESYSASIKQQTRKKPSDTDKLSGVLKPVGIPAEKYARSTFGK